MRQLTLDQARKPSGHGGWRPGAGRPKKKGAVSHLMRARFAQRTPQHVTMRLAADAPSIANRWLMSHVIRPAIRASEKSWFRVVEFNVLGNHMHLIIEASGADQLARGVQGLAVRIARNTNSALNRDGKLFGQRYHARSLKTPTEVRNALRYVLLNRKHHAAEKRFERGWIDPFSSAIWFTGWKRRFPISDAIQSIATEPRPTASPHTWLLKEGWRRRTGLLDYDDTPAA